MQENGLPTPHLALLNCTVQVHKGRLRAVPQTELPLDIRIAAKRQRRPFNSWQLGLGPEVLYTPSTHSSAPAKVLAGGAACNPCSYTFL